MTNAETQTITHVPAIHWTERKEIVDCFLTDGETLRPVECTVDESETCILELKSINTFGYARESFDSLSTDIGEHFKKGHADCPYKEFSGLFNVAIQ